MNIILELPPRARRIPFGEIWHICQTGTTSACAENTMPVTRVLAGTRNYLRVRGEYGPVEPNGDVCAELPPRARRIPEILPYVVFPGGTTSACAENTGCHQRGLKPLWNYLRVRGEYRGHRISRLRSCGTTSACAENTESWLAASDATGNYLRVRGEY